MEEKKSGEKEAAGVMPVSDDAISLSLAQIKETNKLSPNKQNTAQKRIQR